MLKHEIVEKKKKFYSCLAESIKTSMQPAYKRKLLLKIVLHCSSWFSNWKALMQVSHQIRGVFVVKGSSHHWCVDEKTVVITVSIFISNFDFDIIFLLWKVNNIVLYQVLLNFVELAQWTRSNLSCWITFSHQKRKCSRKQRQKWLNCWRTQWFVFEW